MSKADDDFIATMRTRFEKAQDADGWQRDCAMADLKFAFVPGEQWEEKQKKARRGRPCYEFNRLRQSIKQVTGEQRKNRPQVKVRATENSDKKTADTLQGLIRNIEAVSNADRAYDTAFQFAVAGGFGAWRITTDYCSETAWDQELLIREIRNPFIVYFDPGANEWDRRDGLFAFVGERMSPDAFKARWPKADLSSFEMLGDKTRWCTDDSILVCEYWVREPVTRKVLLLSNNETVFEDEALPVLDEMAAAGVTPVKERIVHTHKVTQYLVNGVEKLEPPTEWAGKYIPIVPVWGDLINIEGEDRYSGMVRFSRDTQKLYNYNRTTAQEFVAKSPKAPYLATMHQIQGFEQQWNAANADDAPYLLYSPDPNAPGIKPVREPAPQMPAAMVQMLQLDAEDIKSTSGIYDASLGARSNETSGKAILARQNQGDTATFEYTDNLSRAIRFTGEILVDLIPKIYDTKRTIRVLGEDDSEQFVTLNEEIVDQQTGQLVRVNDVTKGRYDVTVTVGPSYQTARMELADMLMQVSQSSPQVAPILTDLVVKNLDLPGGDEAAKRLRRLAVRQGLVPPNDEDKEDEAKNPPPPNPQAELQMRGMQAEVQSKEIANAQAMKELQAPPETDNGVEAAQLQLEAHKAQAAQEQAAMQEHTKLQIEQMRIAQAQWEKQADIETELAKARIEADTRIQIAMLDQQQKAQAARDATEARAMTDLHRTNTQGAQTAAQ
jgi:hypothetical protein